MKKLMLMLVSLSAIFIFAGCGDSPRDAAVNWYGAILDGDSKKANEYSTENTQTANAFLAASIAAQKDKEKLEEAKATIKKLKNAKEEINGDTAALFVDGEKVMDLKKVDGAWKVDLQK